jgi:hypothetical protein
MSNIEHRVMNNEVVMSAATFRGSTPLTTTIIFSPARIQETRHPG